MHMNACRHTSPYAHNTCMNANTLPYHKEGVVVRLNRTLQAIYIHEHIHTRMGLSSIETYNITKKALLLDSIALCSLHTYTNTCTTYNIKKKALLLDSIALCRPYTYTNTYIHTRMGFSSIETYNIKKKALLLDSIALCSHAILSGNFLWTNSRAVAYCQKKKSLRCASVCVRRCIHMGNFLWTNSRAVHTVIHKKICYVCFCMCM